MSVLTGVGSKAWVVGRPVESGAPGPAFLCVGSRRADAELAALQAVFADTVIVNTDAELGRWDIDATLTRAPLVFVVFDQFDYVEFRELINAAPNSLVVASGELASWFRQEGLAEARIIERAVADRPMDSPALLGAGAVVATVGVGQAFALARNIASASGAPLVGSISAPFTPYARSARTQRAPSERIRDRIDYCDLVLWGNHAMAAKWPARLNAVTGARPLATGHDTSGGVIVNLDFSEMDYSRRNVRVAKQWLDDVVMAARVAGVEYRIVKPPQYTALPRDFAGVTVEAASYHAHLNALNAASVIITPYSRGLRWASAPGKTVHYFNPALDSVTDLNAAVPGAPPVIRRHQDLAAALKSQGGKRWPVAALFGAENANHTRDALQAIATLLASPRSRPNAASDSAAALDRKRVMIVSRMPEMAYSGGRYHALMMAYGLAHSGHDVTLITDHIPIFTLDFAKFQAARDVRFWLTRDFVSDLPDEACDLVILVPGMDREDRLYRSTVNLAATAGARLVLMNFETPNWFNTLSSTKRDWALWRNWLTASEYASGVLSSTEESVKFARSFFPSHVHHAAILGGVNSQAIAQAASPAEPEKRLLIFVSRARYGEHKGAGEIPQILSPALKGYTLVVMSGNDPLDEETRTAIETRCAECGMQVDYVERATDEQKFAQYKRASLLLFPSTFEGYGYPPVEAMACGVRTVAFDLPVLRETGDGWYTFAPRGDYDAFRDAVAAALAEAVVPEARATAIERAEASVGFASYAARLAGYVTAIMAQPTRWDTEGHGAPASTRIQQRFERARPSLAVELDFADAPVSLLPGLTLGGTGARVLILAGRGAGQISRESDSALSALIYHLQSRNIAVDVLAAGNPPSVEPTRWTRVLALPPGDDPARFVSSVLRHYRYTTVLITDSWLIEGRTLTRMAAGARIARLNPPVARDGVASADLDLQTFDSAMPIGPDYYWIARQKSPTPVSRASTMPVVLLTDTEADRLAAEQFVWRYGDMLEKLADGTYFSSVSSSADGVLNVRGRQPIRSEAGDENIRTAIATARVVIDFGAEDAPGLDRARNLASLFGAPTLRRPAASGSFDLRSLAADVLKLVEDDDAWLAATQTDEGLRLLAAPSPYSGVEKLIGLPEGTQFPTPNPVGVLEALKGEQQRAFTDPAWSAALVAEMPGVRVLIDRLRDLEKLRTPSDRDLAFIYASRLARAAEGIEWAQALVLRLGIELRRTAEIGDVARAFAAAFPLEPEARVFAARAFSAGGQFDEARDLLGRGLTLDREGSQLHTELLLVRAALGNVQQEDALRDVRARMAPGLAMGEEWRLLAANLLEALAAQGAPR